MTLCQQNQNRHVYLVWLALYNAADRLFHLVGQRAHLGQRQGGSSSLGHGAPWDSQRFPDVDEA